jgi:hypothetical protein
MIRTLCFVAAALVAAPAAAHSPLRSADWCAGGEIVEVAPFSFVATQLSAAVVDWCAGNPRNCGEFDDPYSRATTLVDMLCSTYQGQTQGDFGEVVAIVTAPRDYFDDNHHASYSYSDGLQGACMRCEMRRATLPIQPLPLPPAQPVGPRTPGGVR